MLRVATIRSIYLETRLWLDISSDIDYMKALIEQRFIESYIDMYMHE